jgi:hypothetical protein
MHIEIPVDVRNGKRCREVKRIGGSCLYEGEERKKQKRIEEQRREKKKKERRKSDLNSRRGKERKENKTKQKDLKKMYN